MADVVDDVAAFRLRYGLNNGKAPRIPTPVEYTFRLGHLQEELDELTNACATNDLPEIADALIDLVYVAVGCTLEWGIPFDSVWNEVQRANMQKVNAKSDGSDSKRGSSSDIVKPKGWKPPNIENALKSVRVPILKRAHDIIDNRSEEKERQYGNMNENCDNAAIIASILQDRHFTSADVIAILIALKLARHNRSYKQDSLLDAAAYIGALDNLIQERGDER